MPAPYSEDLRKKAIAAYEAGEGSQVQIANRFALNPMTFKRYWKRYKETGSFSAIRGKQGRKGSISGKHCEQRLKKIVVRHSDATLFELCKYYNHKKTRKPVGIMVMHRALKRLGIKRKKKSHYAQQRDCPDIQAKRQKFKKRSGR